MSEQMGPRPQDRTAQPSGYRMVLIKIQGVDADHMATDIAAMI